MNLFFAISLECVSYKNKQTQGPPEWYLVRTLLRKLALPPCEVLSWDLCGS
jgi:hypothetical protein